MVALETNEHTCNEHRALRQVHRRVKPVPAGLNVPQRCERRLSPRLQLPCHHQSPCDENIYQFREDPEPQPGTSGYRQNVVC